MRRAVLMTRQAISPRLAIRMRLNMLFLSLDLGRDPSLAVGAYGTGRVAPVVHQNRPEATVKIRVLWRTSARPKLDRNGSGGPLGGLRLPGLAHVPDQAVNEAELVDNDRREDERIEIAHAHGAVDAVHGEGEGQPCVDDGLDVPRFVRVEADARRQLPVAVHLGPHLHAELASHLQSVDDVKIVRPGLGEIFPGMRGRVGRNVVLLPVRRGAFGIVTLQGLTVIGGIVAEHGAAFVQHAAVAHQHVPEIVPDLVAEMPEQRPVGLAHLQPAPLALDVVGLGQRDRDQAVVVAGQDLLPALRIVGEEIEDQAMFGIVLPGLERQLPADQGIEQPVLRHLQLTPAGELRLIRQIRHDAVMPAGAAIAGSVARVRQPVAGIMLGIAAQHATFALGGQRPPGPALSLSVGFDCRHGLLFGQERDTMAAAFAGAVLEIDDVAAGLADKKLQDLASSERELLGMTVVAPRGYARGGLIVPMFGTNSQTWRSLMPTILHPATPFFPYSL